jgi:hypothetical protein
LACSPHGTASIRFLFVAPALCFRLPSDSQSPETPLPSANTCPCRLCRGLSPANECALPGAPRKRRSPRGLRHHLLEHHYLRTKAVRAATASERPSAGPDRARGNKPARIPQWHPGQYEILTNDEPRHQPARPETRPNQRLYVPLGSPPSVAVGSLSAPAAHRSRAPQINTEDDLDCDASKDFKV